MIAIDFQAGAHGHYLEFVCNKFISGISLHTDLPFTALGASHNLQYQAPPYFRCGHYVLNNETLCSKRVVSIFIDYDDILPLQCISLIRAGEMNIIPDDLHNNTWHKFDNPSYQWVNHNLYHSFFEHQIVISYENCRDPSWPRVENIQQYNLLPRWIREECEHTHGLLLFSYDKDNPNCPSRVLREFFKIGFTHPETNGFIKQQRQHQYHDLDVFWFPYKTFYIKDLFIEYVEELATWAKLDAHVDQVKLSEVHDEFLQRQPYKHAKARCDSIVGRIQQRQEFKLPNMDVIQQAYIESCLERMYNVELPVDNDLWFTHSIEIIKLISKDGSRHRH